MKIGFRKIANSPKHVNICFNADDCEFLHGDERVSLEGDLSRVDSRLIKFSGRISGLLDLVCVKTGESFIKELSEDLVLYFSDGFWEMQSQKADYDLDVIEFFDGFIDFAYVIDSEVWSMRLDYNIKE